MWDLHMHSQFSGDSDAPTEDMIKAALAKGLDGICLTEHEDIDYPDDPTLFLLDLKSYHATVSSLQKKYADKLPILYGVELGLQPHLKEAHLALTNSEPLDFVIASSHVVHGQDPYYPAYFEGRSEKEAYLEYFESILENIVAFDDFDVYGHLDYVVRYGPNKNHFYKYEDYVEVIDEILRTLIAKGKGLEVNTGGFKYGLGHPNPTEDILKRYRALGGEILTTGADAHVPEHVAYDFCKLPALLKECGFSYYTVFRERKARFIPI